MNNSKFKKEDNMLKVRESDIKLLQEDLYLAKRVAALIGIDLRFGSDTSTNCIEDEDEDEDYDF